MVAGPPPFEWLSNADHFGHSIDESLVSHLIDMAFEVEELAVDVIHTRLRYCDDSFAVLHSTNEMSSFASASHPETQRACRRKTLRDLSDDLTTSVGTISRNSQTSISDNMNWRFYCCQWCIDLPHKQPTVHTDSTLSILTTWELSRLELRMSNYVTALWWVVVVSIPSLSLEHPVLLCRSFSVGANCIVCCGILGSQKTQLCDARILGSRRNIWVLFVVQLEAFIPALSRHLVSV